MHQEDGSRLNLTLWQFIVLISGIWLLSPPTAAGERKAADVECVPVEQKLVYDCRITLKGKRSGEPITDAEFTVGADMPTMPGAHNVKPVPAEPHETPGTYRALIHLEMTGDWALKLDFTKPSRDRVVKKIYFGRAKENSEDENDGAKRHEMNHSGDQSTDAE